MDTTHEFTGSARTKRAVPPSWRLETGKVWLEALPLDWHVEKFSRAVQVAEGQVDPTEDPYADMVLIAPNHIESRTGRLILEETAAQQAAISGKYLCGKDDVIYSKIRPELAKVVIAPRACLCSANMYPIKATAPLTGRYLFYFLLSRPFTDWVSLESSRVAMPKVNRETLSEIRIPVPQPETQRAIADLLDAETALIDALIAAKENLLAILAEKRRALVTQAVTRGLDPSVPMRDSGIPWLGEIPAHWEVTRLKLVATVQSGLALGKKYGNEELTEYPYLRVANVQDGYLDLSDVKTVEVSERDSTGCRLQAGDVLMNEGGDADKLGRGAIWTGEIDPCLHQNHVFAVRPQRVSSEWLNLWTSGDGAKAFFESRAKQSTNLASISATNLKELPIPVPPVEEQASLVQHVKEELEKVGRFESATHSTISLLRERREAVIAAAVTGQLDVEVA